MGWLLLIVAVLGHLSNTGIKGIAGVQLTEERGVLRLSAVLVTHIVLGWVFGADLIESRHHARLNRLRIHTRLHHEIPVEHVTHKVAAAVRRRALFQ